MTAVNHDAILWQPDKLPTPLLLAFWRARTPAVALQATCALIDPGGYGNDLFRRLWAVGFPNRAELPDEPIALKDGRGTEAFWKAFA